MSSRSLHQILPVLLIVCLLISAIAITGCGKQQNSYFLGVLTMSGDGNVSPNYGIFNEGDSVTLTAIPASGWVFDHWSESVNGSQNPLTIVINSDKTVYAYFRKLISPTTTPMQTVAPGTVVAFPDENLDKAIREAIGKPIGDIHQSDLNSLTCLSAIERGISDLTGIEHCTNLWFLALSGNSISNISTLSGLTDLQDLYLYNNSVSDISALSSLTNLWWLVLETNQISNILPLSGLTSLSRLYLGDNNISNISALSGLTGLQELNLHKNNISNLKPLVDNSGLALRAGYKAPVVYIENNPLSAASLNNYLPILEGRGITIYR